jgi:ribonuclease P protein component
MKRAHRLRRPEQFHRVRQQGRSWETRLLRLQAVANRRRTTRCGFVVSKRIGGSVERNRAKRRVREAVRLIYHHIAPGWDVVFIIRTPAVITIEFTQLQSLVEQLLRQASLWQELPSQEV